MEYKRGNHKTIGIYERFIKKPIDILLSMGTLIILSILLSTAVLVRVKLGCMVLLSQEKLGKDEKNFRIYKFCSMSNQKDDEGNLLSDEMRLTRFGWILRSTSLYREGQSENFHLLCNNNALKGFAVPERTIANLRPNFLEDGELFSSQAESHYDYFYETCGRESRVAFSYCCA